MNRVKLTEGLLRVFYKTCVFPPQIAQGSLFRKKHDSNLFDKMGLKSVSPNFL